MRKKHFWMWLVAVGLGLLLMVNGVHAADHQNSFVKDDAGVLSDETLQSVSDLNYNQLSKIKGKPQYAVITKSGLPGNQDIDDYAIDQARKLGLGRPGWHNGVLLVLNVKPGQHEARLEVGTGLQGALPDGAVSQIFTNQQVQSNLHQHHYDQAVQTISNLVEQRLRQHQGDIYTPSQTQQRMEREQTNQANQKEVNQNLMFVALLLVLVGISALAFSMKNWRHRSRKSYDRKVLDFLQKHQLATNDEVLINRMVDNLTAKQTKPTAEALWQAFNEENLKLQGINRVVPFPALTKGPMNVTEYQQQLAQYEQERATREQQIRNAATTYLAQQGYPDDPEIFMVALLGTPAVQKYIETGTDYSAAEDTIADQFRRHMLINFMQTDPQMQQRMQRKGATDSYANYVNRMSSDRVNRIYNGGNINRVLLMTAVASLVGSFLAGRNHHDHFDGGSSFWDDDNHGDTGGFFGGSDGGSDDFGGFGDSGGSFGGSFGGDSGGFDGGGGDSSGW
ncbi:TPM domain-containing protein [Fructilactobacillus hinvesii]|uniref:TPM domain-containing protein n=1 Tax=Fructilactobacillus hinvesii TaxID=2940300 RepID=A0ABY5BTJ7_9LACO|nr:TPM domain-containing protein [Fructilactobacillus hinvesii]USS87950.1 TPM domain-containing protein [Fructilactobacillus hinvesii]